MATPRSLSSVLASLLLLSLFACRCLGATNPEMMTRNNTTRALKEIPKISAVMLTTSKDTRVFETGLKSCLKYLVDVDKFYVITPDYKDVKEKYGAILGERVIFVDEKIGFPFNMEKVGDVMYNTVKEHGTYPLDDGKSQFEKTLWGKLGWFLQQLLKIYAGNVLKLEDYVLLDSDCVWHREVSFISKNQEDGKPTKYYYTTSTQYHPPYIATMKRVAGVDTFQSSKDERFRSGVVHHMVLSKDVLSDLFETSEKLHSPLPFWQVMLNQSALEMTCRAPRAGICGAGSTLSEYELYFNFARVKHPDTVELRPLLWANGPMPGMLYWPDPAGKFRGVKEDVALYRGYLSQCGVLHWKAVIFFRHILQ